MGGEELKKKIGGADLTGVSVKGKNSDAVIHPKG